MERMKKRMIRGILLILPLLFFSCRDPLALIETLEDEVKSANSLYLRILSVTPEANDTDFNPGSEIRITFDRAVDLETIKKYFDIQTQGGVSFEDEEAENTLTYEYNSNTNTLTVSAFPYLSGLENYKLVLKEGLISRDGSRIRESETVYFHTSDAPRGSVTLEGDYYTASATVSVEINTEAANFYRVSDDLSDFDDVSFGWTELTSQSMTIPGISISGPDGVKTVYAQFRDGAVGDSSTATKSPVESTTVYYDTTPPVVTISGYTSTLYSNAVGALRSISGSANDGTGSGVESYEWSYTTTAGDSLTFTDEASPSTTVSADTAANEDYTLILRATDSVGNTSTGTLTGSRKPFTFDNIAPSAPTFVLAEGSSIYDATPLSSTYPETDDRTPYVAASVGSGGTTYFRYSLDGGSWVYFSGTRPYQMPNTKLFPSGILYGGHTVAVQGRDLAGNWSSSTNLSNPLVVYPSSKVLISPSSGGRIGSGDLVWYDSNYYYQIRLWNSSGTVLINDAGDGAYRTRPFVDLSKTSILPKTTYYWRISVYDKSKQPVSVLPGVKSSYSFTQ